MVLVAMAYSPKCYKVRIESERFIIQSLHVEPIGVTLDMKKARIKEDWLPTCKRQGVKCKINVSSVSCSRKGSGKGKIREFTKFRKVK